MRGRGARTPRGFEEARTASVLTVADRLTYVGLSAAEAVEPVAVTVAASSSAGLVPGSMTLSSRSRGASPEVLVARTWTASTSPTATASVPGRTAAAASAVPGSGAWSAS
jgi:hypothetical protein